MSEKIHDVIIVGSGPAGYTAAIYAARAALEPIMFEGSLDSGGALMNTTEVENYPGFAEGIMGPDLMFQMRAQAERFGTQIITDDATELKLDEAIKEVTDSDGTIWKARAVILAMGSGYRKLGLPDEDRLSGRGVSWCATCDGAFFRDKEIAVVGGGDSAMEEATFLSRFASKVTIIHRRSELRASAIMAGRAERDPKIEFAWNSSISRIDGEKSVESVALTDTVTGETRELPVQGLFIAVGHDPRSELVKGSVELDDEGYVLTQPGTTGTNLVGVYACGDLVDHTYRQAITAAGTGCSAALDAEKYLAALDDIAMTAAPTS
ncbi:MAG: thioredoxin-disulfide reductase [Arachnia sp.]